MPEQNHNVVLITGALAGIGRATAIAFARDGYRVVISGRREDAGQALCKELQSLGAEAEFIRADVRYEDDVCNLIDKTVARFGRLDAAVNNAGVESSPQPIIEQTPENYAAVFDTNVLGVLLCLKHEMRVMIPQKSGSIINLSSTLGRQAVALTSLYAASKHAVEGLTKAAALEGASSGVRVNIVAPGPIKTDMLNRFTATPQGMANLVAGVPLKRTGTPEEVAEAIVFLASPKASFITGTTVGVDGGKMAGPVASHLRSES